MRKALIALAMSLCAVAVLQPAASAAPVPLMVWAESYQDTTNLATQGFAKSSGGVSLGYWCSPVAGNTKVQLVSLNQLTAYRSFEADCDWSWHTFANLNVGSNTAMRARIHNYSANGFVGRVEATFDGYLVP